MLVTAEEPAGDLEYASLGDAFPVVPKFKAVVGSLRDKVPGEVVGVSQKKDAGTPDWVESDSSTPW